MTNIRLFNKWDTSKIEVSDPGLRKYISLPGLIIPRTFGRNNKARFGKSKNHIVERLMGKIIVTVSLVLTTIPSVALILNTYVPALKEEGLNEALHSSRLLLVIET